MTKKPPQWNEKVSLRKLFFNKPEEFELDQNCPSVRNLLNELEANLEKEEQGKGSLLLQLAIERRSNPHYGDYLLFYGNIQGFYHSPCVRCLVPARCPVDVNFSACFLSDHYQEQEEYQDVTSLYIDGQEREIYFHHNETANLQEILHENIFINIEPFPLHDPNCRGICLTCGVNLNTSSCPH